MLARPPWLKATACLFRLAISHTIISDKCRKDASEKLFNQTKQQVHVFVGLF